MKQLIVVEGKSDTRRLKEYYPNIITFETSGLGFDEKKIKQLKKLSKDYEIIVFTDPDRPGEMIRNVVKENIPQAKHAYLPNIKAISKDEKKVGIEHANKKDIDKALSNLYEFKEIKEEYTMEDMIEYGLFNNKVKRAEFCDDLNIAFGNNKKVLKQLNYFAIERKKIAGIKDDNGTSKYPRD